MNVLPGLFGKALDSGLDWDKRDDSTVITTSSSTTVQQSNVSRKEQSVARLPYRTIEHFVRDHQHGTIMLNWMRNNRDFMLTTVRQCVDPRDLSDADVNAIVARFLAAVTSARSPPVGNIEEPSEGQSESPSVSTLREGSSSRGHAAPQNAAAPVAPFAGEALPAVGSQSSHELFDGALSNRIV